MELFKRILLSLFPENIVNQPINPITMFVSFISAKQFFSVINRKIVENYKLNLFDISLDSFEVKIWFWEQPNIKVKDIDLYYSYGVVANFNWYRFLSHSNVGSSMAIVTSIYVNDIFKKYKYTYFVNFLLSVYLLWFLFISRLKVFPYDDKQKNYKWFIDIFFEFYLMVIEQTGEKVNNKEFSEIKTKLLKNIQIFFMLFYYYQRLNILLYDEILSEKEFYNWLFYDELKKGTYKFMLMDFVDNYERYSRDSSFSNIEKKIMNLIFPADILIRYLMDWEDLFMVVENIITGIYDKSILDNYINWFLKNDENLEKFILYITDYRLFKENYFKWIKKFTIHKFRTWKPYQPDDEIEEFMSTIWEATNLENIKIPDRIKQESVLMEKFINFYMTYIWWFWIARWDNYNIRLFRRDILKELLKYTDIIWLKQDVLLFYGWLLYNYSKNVFYYKYAFDSVRAGKEKFNLPFRSTFREVYSNMFILKLFDEDFIWNILQDMNSKDIKIYIQNKEILNMFKDSFWDHISKLVKLTDRNLIKKIYGNVWSILKDIENFEQIIYDNLKKDDILNIKESIYTIDFWIWYKLLEDINDENMNLSLRYSDFSILWILSFFRDTWFGFLIYLKYLELEQNNLWVDLKLNTLKKIYIIDIIWITDDFYLFFEDFINMSLDRYSDILSKWISIDSNDKYFTIWLEDWQTFIEMKDDDKILSDISGEDIIWFRWFLKNINFYNKRYLIPKD